MDKVIKPPIVHIDISGIMLDLDHVKGLLKVCHSTLLTVHCGINNSVSKEQFEDVNRQYRDVCFSFSPPLMIFIGKTVVGQTLTKKLDKVVCVFHL